MNWASYIGLFIGEAIITSYLLYEIGLHTCTKEIDEDETSES